MVELSQAKIWKFGFLKLTSFAQTWCEMWAHVFKKSSSGDESLKLREREEEEKKKSYVERRERGIS